MDFHHSRKRGGTLYLGCGEEQPWMEKKGDGSEKTEDSTFKTWVWKWWNHQELGFDWVGCVWFWVSPQNRYFDGVWFRPIRVTTGFPLRWRQGGSPQIQWKDVKRLFNDLMIFNVDFCRFRVPYFQRSPIFCVGPWILFGSGAGPRNLSIPRMDPILESVNPSIKQRMNGLLSTPLLWQLGDDGLGTSNQWSTARDTHCKHSKFGQILFWYE